MTTMQENLEALTPNSPDNYPNESQNQNDTNIPLRSCMVNGRSDPLPVQTIIFNKQVVTAVIDTGSAISIVRDAIARDLPMDTTLRSTANGITGHSLNLIGTVRAHLQILGQKVEHDFRVMVDSPYDVLLGIDVLKELEKIYFDCKRMKLIRLKEDITTQDNKESEHQVLLDKTLWIDEWSEVIFPVPIDSEDGIQLFFEPSRQLEEKYNLIATAILSEQKEGKIPIRLLNLNHIPITLCSGLHLGIAQVVMNVTLNQRNEAVEITDDIKLDESELPLENKLSLVKLLQCYHHLFAKDEYDLGMSTVVKHSIIVNHDTPIAQRPYRIPHALRDECGRQIKGMLDHGIIRQSASPWASPIVMVKKKEGTLRFCVDYRKLNAMTRKDTYPLPRIDEMLDRLGHAQYFTILDLQSGFWQI